MRIIDLQTADADLQTQAAQLLHDEFNQAKWDYSWPTLDEAQDEIREMCDPERLCYAAIDADGRVIGWIGAIPQYNGNVWELHPLVVAPKVRGQGIGRALVHYLEDQVRGRGGITMILGSDDQDQMTSLGGVDLYPNVWEHIANIRNLKGHPYEFYQKLGYVIVGVYPDANGLGKPDIFLAKRMSSIDKEG
ncbi:MAG: GNAT family N-acetyltransferase [Anaerolineae bacterium]|jgi:aminoglycoside 6'-N-acetyltransferase I|nr:GNAT family N-acetyltransferase [Anaerolineae bacterium]